MPVLATKLHVPEPRADLVSRPRLQERLAAAELDSTRLVLVSAPAGSGKTTVVSQWLAASGAQRVAWVSLDAADNDVRQHLAHLLAAFRTTNPDVGQDAQKILDGASSVPVSAVLTELVNDLDTLADPTALVLDDYHAVDDTQAHEALGFLLDHLPRHVCVVVTTRSDPPLPLARLRSTGGLVELRADDLRFTPDEAGTLLNDVMGLGLGPAEIGTLDERTEGWAAGLQLAALSMRGRDDTAAFVDAFAGSHRFVLDYLLEEVLAGQPDDVRDFLLTTSVLREMNATLADAVTGRADARAVLEVLDRGNVFVVPLDDHRTWYRYHHLFADALRARLLAEDPDRATETHRAASRWFAERGILDDAIGHAAASGDHERTADLVELVFPDLRKQRRDDTIRRWVSDLPADVVRPRPLLATAMGWTRLAEGDLGGVESWLDVAESGTATPMPDDLLVPGLADAVAARDQELRELPAMIAVYRASVAQARGDVDGTVAHAQRALDLAGPDDHFSRGAAAGFLGLAAWAAGDLATAVDTFREAVGSLRAAGNVADALGSSVVFGNMWLGRGRPDEARRLYERALAAADDSGTILSTTGDLHVGLADVLREAGELVAAEQHLDTARRLGDAASLPENRHRWFTVKARLLRAQGDPEAALALLDDAEATYQPGFFPHVRPIAAARARLAVALGRLDDAERWAAEQDVTDADAGHSREYDQLTLAILRVAQHRGDEVLPMLDRIVDVAASSGRDGSAIEARTIRALAHAGVGPADAALDDLAAAISTGVPVGYARLFLDHGEPMLGLLRQLEQPEATQLLALADRPAPSAEPDPDHDLSDRELEVLRLLATDLTGPDIADRLFISVNTLRTHTKHIFTKLDVNTRRAAVSRAADLQLL